jgi:hypothetical protein
VAAGDWRCSSPRSSCSRSAPRASSPPRMRSPRPSTTGRIPIGSRSSSAASGAKRTCSSSGWRSQSCIPS